MAKIIPVEGLVMTLIIYDTRRVEQVVEAAERLRVPYFLLKETVTISEVSPEDQKKHFFGLKQEKSVWRWTVHFVAGIPAHEHVIGGVAFMDRPTLHTFRIEVGGEEEIQL